MALAAPQGFFSLLEPLFAGSDLAYHTPERPRLLTQFITAAGYGGERLGGGVIFRLDPFGGGCDQPHRVG